MPVRINAGMINTTFVDSLNRTWGPDRFFTGGTPFNVSASCPELGKDALLYCTERYGQSTYRFRVNVNQRYTINIHFAEFVYQIPGVRTFNVSVNNRTVASNLDLYATAGYRKPYVLRIRGVLATTVNPFITIKFMNIKENAKVAGIEIVRWRKVETPSPVTKKVPTKAPVRDIKPAPVPAPVGPPAPVSLRLDPPLRINAGATANWTDPISKVVWLSDRYFANGLTYGTMNCTDPIEGTDLDPLFCTERFFPTGSVGTVAGSYMIPMKNGTYTVKLVFAETFFKLSGNRTFGVTMQGKVVTQNFDIISLAGPNNAVVLSRSVTVNPTEPGISIEFIGGTNNPKINAIQITKPNVGLFDLGGSIPPVITKNEV
jgi:Malectin domain